MYYLAYGPISVHKPSSSLAMQHVQGLRVKSSGWRENWLYALAWGLGRTSTWCLPTNIILQNHMGWETERWLNGLKYIQPLQRPGIRFSPPPFSPQSTITPVPRDPILLLASVGTYTHMNIYPPIPPHYIHRHIHITKNERNLYEIVLKH